MRKHETAVCGTARTVVWEVGKCENRRQMPFMISIYLLPDYCRFYMCCHFVEGGLLEQAEDLVYYLVDIRGVVEFFQLFVEFVFHLFADLVGQFVNSLVGLVFEL